MSEEAPDFEGAESAVLDKGSVHLAVVSSNFHSSVNVAKAVCGTVSTQTTKNNTVVKRISDREEARRDADIVLFVISQDCNDIPKSDIEKVKAFFKSNPKVEFMVVYALKENTFSKEQLEAKLSVFNDQVYFFNFRESVALEGDSLESVTNLMEAIAEIRQQSKYSRDNRKEIVVNGLSWSDLDNTQSTSSVDISMTTSSDFMRSDSSFEISSSKSSSEPQKESKEEKEEQDGSCVIQ